jgi:predicted RND superfamily exporter protein
MVAVVICAVAVGVGTGMTRTEQAPDLVEALVPDRTDLEDALERIDSRFADSQRTTTAQLIVRGEAVDPVALVALDETIALIVADPAVAPFVVGDEAVVSPPSLIAQAAGVTVENLTAADVETVVSEAGRPGSGDLALGDLLVRDEAGEIVAAVGWIELRRGEGTGDEVLAAERRIGRLLEAADLGPVSARALTNAAFEDATDQAMDDSLALFPVAIVVLVVILYVGFRSTSDVLATFGGMVLVTVFTLGAEGWLGPNGAGVLGGSTAIGVVIPVLLVGLTVDYALQVTSAYRGLLAERRSPQEAVAGAVGRAGAAVALGAATTALSFLTNVASPLGPVRDFGILAAIGIGAGLVIMTGFVPAVRAVTDPKRGLYNRALLRGELLADVGVVGRALRGTFAIAARNPATVVVASSIVCLGALVLAVGVDIRFQTEDFLPEDSSFVEDLQFLEDEVGGADSTVTAVIAGDRRDPQVIGSIAGLQDALAAPDRPDWIAGPARVLVDEAEGDDTTLLVVPVRLGDVDERREAMRWFDDRWVVDDGSLTLTGELVLPVVVADAVARGQLISTGLVIVAALAVLTTYFSRYHERGLLGAVVVAPIVLVLVLVLATMRLLDIPYNALTATLTALTIGIGVDYTIHVVHRYLTERETGAAPTVALRRLSASTGGALLVSAVTTMVGFGVLVAAPLPAVGQLGFLTALTVALSFVVSILVLPALLVLAESVLPPRVVPPRPVPEPESAREEVLNVRP